MHRVSRITSVLDTWSKKMARMEGEGEEQFVNTRKVGRTNIGETISLRFFDRAFHRMFYFLFFFYSYSLFCSFFLFLLSVTV